MMTTNAEKNQPSLLTYLRPGGEWKGVRLSVTRPDPELSDRYLPFQVLSDSDPVFRLLEGEFVTDSGTVLKKVCLLLQKDNYRPLENNSWPITNLDIEVAWRKAFSLQRQNADGFTCILLAEQGSDPESLVPLSPLFFCKEKETYFHPPCPLCGAPLDLCRDDAILIASGLRPYSDSLKRYLYCKSCNSGREEQFYTYEIEPDDPRTLRDRWTLIRDFGSLRSGSSPRDSFPCDACPERDACYGPDFRAGSRVVPFSFYPFYLLIHEAFDLNSRHFLALLAGASRGDLQEHLDPQKDRAGIASLSNFPCECLPGHTFFPSGDDRRFMEVLYLKLTFLGDALGQLLTRRVLGEHPDMRISLDGIWVKLPGQSPRLPGFWNFRTGIIDIVKPKPEGRFFATVPSFNLLLHAGLVWFQALLLNSRQGGRELFQAIENEIMQGFGGVSATHGQAHSATSFQPENIFWNPEGEKVPTAWQPFWRQALDRGFELLNAAFSADTNWSNEPFFSGLEKLRSDIRSAMFAAASSLPAGSALEAAIPDDRVLHDALLRIMENWRGKAAAEEKPLPTREELESMDTIIISSPRGVPDVPPPSGNFELTETVMLSPAKPEVVSNPGSHETVDSLPETVILKPAKPEAGDAVPETVILAPKKPEAGDSVPETVVLAPNRPGPGEDTPETPEERAMPDTAAPGPAYEDPMAETVILPPRKTKPPGTGIKDKHD